MRILEEMDVQEYIFKLHAEMCKVLAHPKRLKILNLLSEAGRPLSVGEISSKLDLRSSNVSQHLALLRARHIVRAAKVGQQVFYQMADARITEAIRLLRAVLIDSMRQEGEKANAFSSQEILYQNEEGNYGRG